MSAEIDAGDAHVSHGFGSLADIVDNGYCIGCGLCVPLAPAGRIEMVEASNGHRRPVAAAPIPGDQEQAILRHCPGVNITGPFAAEPPVPAWPSNPVWGAEARVATGWASDPALRRRASTGGVMSAINTHLLRSGRVAFVLQVAPDPNDALHSVPVMIDDPDDLLGGAQSRYASCSPLEAVGRALDRREPFAVSLKPCDVAGVRNLQRTDERARNQIVFTQSMFCGTVPGRSDSLAMLARRGIDPSAPGSSPVTFRWRGEGCPGATVAQLADGTRVTATYNELWNDNPWTTQFRCKVCPDAVGLQADVATGDSWDGGVPAGESMGTNVVIAHTELGAEILAECEAAGALTLDDVEPTVLDATQPHHVVLRQTWMSRVAGATVGGLPAPSFTHLAAAETAAQLHADRHAAVFAGALDRVRAGHADERDTPDYGATNTSGQR